MLPGGLDATYRNALATSHERYFLVEVLDGSGNVLPIPSYRTSDTGGLVFIGGSVSATLTNRVSRGLELTLDEALYPHGPGFLLAPYGNRIRVWAGIQFAEGTRYRWVIFTGRIQDVVSSSSGQVSVSAADRGNEVVEAEFLRPENSSAGATVYAEFQRLVSDAIPDAVFGVSDQVTLRVPQLTWESDRAGALDEMATSAGCYWYALADGSFVLRRYPFATAAPSILALHDGPEGTISAAPSRGRQPIYNSITVTGERADGTTPVYGLAQDLNPASPTYVFGNFGRRHKTVSLRTPATQGSAQSAAEDYLRSSIALSQAWTWGQPTDAALELGDVVTLNAREESGIIQVVSAFVISLEAGAAMSVTGRAQIVGLLEGS